MQPQSFIFIGRSGAGKGTQAKLLSEALTKKDPVCKILYVETGAELRKFFAGDGYTQSLTKKVIEAGYLMPEYMAVYIWSDVLVRCYTGGEHLIFDGTPRKLDEAQMLESVFPFYSLPKPWVIYLDVDHEESKRRISLRAKNSGRADDSAEALEKRRVAYENEVKPTVDWYRAHEGVKFLDVDGERAIDEIHTDIVKRLGLA